MKRLKSIQAVVAVAVLLFLAVPASYAQQHNSANPAAAGFAVEKYISTEFGFAASFPTGEIERVQKNKNLTQFTSYNAEKTWWGMVGVLENVPYEIGPVNKEFVDFFFLSLFKNDRKEPMILTSAVSYSTLQGYPAVSAEFTKKRPGQVVAGRITYVFVKERNRIYAVNTSSVPGQEQQATKEFMQSFEIR